MNILAVETATKIASCAVSCDNALLAECFYEGSLAHSQTLLGLVDQTLAQAGCEIGEIDCFAADIGPGSFTGVRIGVATVNAFAFALGKSAAGVTSLSILAENIAKSENLVCPMIDARGGRVYAALFGRLKIDPFAGDICEFLSQLPDREIIFTGSGAYEHFEKIKKAVPLARLAEESYSRLKAGNLARLAAGCQKETELTPLYLQKTQAERNAQST